jgi:hypothetical protein
MMTHRALFILSLTFYQNILTDLNDDLAQGLYQRAKTNRTELEPDDLGSVRVYGSSEF